VRTGTGITQHGCIGHHWRTRLCPVQSLILDKIAKALSPTCDEKGFDGGPLCEDDIVRRDDVLIQVKDLVTMSRACIGER
jgi:hypothetical protein